MHVSLPYKYNQDVLVCVFMLYPAKNSFTRINSQFSSLEAIIALLVINNHLNVNDYQLNIIQWYSHTKKE